MLTPKKASSIPNYTIGSGIAASRGEIITERFPNPTGLKINGIDVPITSSVRSEPGFTLHRFITPAFTEITEDKDLEAIITSASGTLTGNFKLSVLPLLTVNTPNSFNRTLNHSGFNRNHYYKFVSVGTAILINLSGYTGDSAMSAFATDLTNGSQPIGTVSSFGDVLTNTSSTKITGLSTASTYVIQIASTKITGSTTYNIGIASQAISNGASCNRHAAASLCVDYLIPGTAAQADCTGTYNAGQTCAGLALGTIVARCTLPSATGIGTAYYYSTGGAAFSVGTASTACNNITNSILQTP